MYPGVNDHQHLKPQPQNPSRCHSQRMGCFNPPPFLISTPVANSGRRGGKVMGPSAGKSAYPEHTIPPPS